MKEVKAFIENELRKKYLAETINDEITFVVSESTIVKIGTIGKSIVVEYSDNMKDAKNNIYEDGGVFSTEIYSNDEILRLVIEEISKEDIHTTNHGFPKYHDFGENGEQ